MKKQTLKNGIPVFLEHMEGTNVSTVLILFRVGSRNEKPKINGISHFLEHLFFKGTINRPTTLDISRELDGLGAEFNAFTSKDFTGYYVKVASQHTEKAIEILEDLLFNPLFDAEEIERERGVIVEEINMYEDNPMAISDEFSEQLMYGANHPLGYRIAGPPENIMTMTRKQIMDYRDTYYHPDNMVVIATGNLPKDIKQIVSKHFEHHVKQPTPTPQPKQFKVTQKSPRLHIEKKQTAQSHIALTFPSENYTSNKGATVKLLSTILGGNMSSRLFINVRERQGLCYYIRAHVSPYTDVGAFTVQAGFDNKRIHKATAAIIEELVALRDEGITEVELQKAKEYIRGKMSIQLEDSENVASWWGKQGLFYKEFKTFKQYQASIDAVTLAQVNSMAKTLFTKQHANLAIIGPYTERQKKAFMKHLDF